MGFWGLGGFGVLLEDGMNPKRAPGSCKIYLRIQKSSVLWALPSNQGVITYNCVGFGVIGRVSGGFGLWDLVLEGVELGVFSEVSTHHCRDRNSLLQQPGPKKFKLFRIGPVYKAKKFKVLPLAI